MLDGQPIAVFQPFIDTATGRIAGVEALARLRGDNGVLHSAGPLFSDPKTPSSALRRLDREIRCQALQQFQQAPADWFLSLNISPRWITRLRAEQPLPSLKQLQLSAVDASRVVFEITELSGTSSRLKKAVTQYREAGARVAIDDFGAGYSQLDRVLALQPDILKLDMQLFQDAARGGPSSEVVRALAKMAEKTGCWIIAEGVETEAQLHFALECGARYVQGFLFAKPSPTFHSSDAFVEHFAQLRDRYVAQKLNERLTQIDQRKHMQALLNSLAAWPLNKPPPALPASDRYPWLIRIYQCDANGNQVTANYQRHADTWLEDSRYLGHNWSWRPYFHQLVSEGREESRMICSGTYRDATSNLYCLTAGQFINDGQHLLLMDIDASGF
ncbi:EAL domain-containing protein [Pseudomonas sp.]|uniref:EAL domain-containing protein n=1 Tax=Pseudomonas sp. TaxID=306 RepID=UPI00257D81D4|nr:EAL domain-containing protein [Pseudomonas sp.]